MYPRYGHLLLVLAYHVVTGLSLPATTYDQRQTGDLNVQVHLKDVKVLALLDSELLDDYTEYDYFYDYADFTVKPSTKPTTTTTEIVLSTSEAAEQVDSSGTSDFSSQNSTSLSIGESANTNSTTGNTELLSPENVEETNKTLAISSVETSKNSTDEDNMLRTRFGDRIKNLLENDEEDPTKQNSGGASTENPSKKLSRKRCRSGYSPDGRGRCRRLNQQRLSLIPLAMRLAPKLLDGLARSTRNLAQEEVDRMHSNRAVL